MKTTTLAASLAAAPLAGTAVQAADSAQYEVRIDATRTATSHPLDYPGNAHFSGLVEATHNDGYRVFADGMQPTPGLVRARRAFAADLPCWPHSRSLSSRRAGGERFLRSSLSRPSRLPNLTVVLDSCMF